jgi:hypothetical protein
MMKKLLAAVCMMAVAGAVYARCTTQTFIGSDGRMTVCTVCCDSRGNCTTTCM